MKMKIVVAPDSFKGSLTQLEAAQIMKQAVLEVILDSHVIVKPMADGGEGTLDALLAAAAKSERIPIEVIGPLGKAIHTSIGVINEDTAVIEIASICGLLLVPEEERHPYNTTTYGIGQAIRIALDRGIRQVMIGLGGSATNDGGFGMLAALGVRFRNAQGEPVGFLGKNLFDIQSIDVSQLDPRLKETCIDIASDVDNILCGAKGATYVFGPQKGVTDAQLKPFDDALTRYSHLLGQAFQLEQTLANTAGAGAAGGLGFALLHLGAHVRSGAKLIADHMKLENDIATADVVLTGEGKSDEQTLYGKAPGYVAELAKKYDVPTILISGIVDDLKRKLEQHFSEVFELKEKNVTIERAMAEANVILLNKTKTIMRRLYHGKRDSY